MAQVIDLPVAPFRLNDDEAQFAGASVVVRLMDEQVVRGLLQELDGAQARVSLRRAPDGVTQVIPLSDIRYLGFLRPVTPSAIAADARDNEENLNSIQTFQVSYRDGKSLSGKACAVDIDRYGIHIYQSKDHRHIHRAFIPLAVAGKYQIGPRLGAVAAAPERTAATAPVATEPHPPEFAGFFASENVEDLTDALEHGPRRGDSALASAPSGEGAASEHQLREALDIQKRKRELHLGEILEQLGAVTPEQTAQALQLQARNPNKKLGEILERLGFIDNRTLQRALEQQKRERNTKLSEILEEIGATNSEEVQMAVAKKFGIPFVRLRNFDIDPDVLVLVPEHIASGHNLIPLFMHREHLVMAMTDPLDVEAINLVRFVTGHAPELAVATKSEIRQAIDKHYQGHATAKILDELEILSHEQDDKDTDVRRDEAMSNEKPIVRLVDNIITDAVRRNASDIHIRPEEGHVSLLFRIDGSMIQIRRFPKNLLSAVVSRIKILGGMDISERRVPQDGRFRVSFRSVVIDLRISVMPSVQGESVVMRILNTQVGLKSVDQLGFNPRDLGIFTDLLNKSYGIVLVTGPTGSGKSTTLYSALQEINKRSPNIITIEDPVEYRISGIEQMQVNVPAGFTFARALRNILRHDPDVIMVGEIRDQETGKIAVESALTGHLVLSTLHTNDAAGAITRLIEMGVEPYLVRSAVLGVLAQRLVRRNCPHCLAEEVADPAIRQALNVPADEAFYRGKGCDQCNQTGYRGRMAVYELIPVTQALRNTILDGVSTDVIRAEALSQGMVPLTEQALSQARLRKTSLDEVYRVRLE